MILTLDGCVGIREEEAWIERVYRPHGDGPGAGPQGDPGGAHPAVEAGHSRAAERTTGTSRPGGSARCTDT